MVKTKRFMRTLTAAIALMIAFCFTGGGCSKFGDGEKIDNTKTQLSVSNYDGGIGTQWVREAAARFEEKYAEHEFEEGKKGIQISFIERETKGATLDISAEEAHVIFQEDIPINQWKNYFEDISDIVTETLSAYGESESIEDKLNENTRTVLGFGEDGKYYILPHYQGFNGIQYDVTYFDDNELYFAKNGGWTNLAGERAAGPDGTPGNADDGLPSTHEEFVELMKRIVFKGGAPLLWTGGFGDSYFNKLIEAFADAYVGKENAELFYTFDSNGREVEVITGFNGNTPVTDRVVINEKNGYYVYQMAGRYYALQMAQTVIGGDGYTHRATSGSVTNGGAQELFVFGVDEPSTIPGYKPSAMLVEGNYWYNEAAAYLEEHDKTYDPRTYAYMPLPTKVNGTVAAGTKHTMRDSLMSYGFVKKGIENENVKQAAKMFLQFCYTDAELEAFTVKTGMTRNIDYDVDTSKLNSYAKSVWDYRKDADITELHDLHDIYISNETAFGQFSWSANVNGSTVRYPRPALIAGTSAKDYFTGMWVSADNWETNYRQYFSVGD